MTVKRNSERHSGRQRETLFVPNTLTTCGQALSGRPLYRPAVCKFAFNLPLII